MNQKNNYVRNSNGIISNKNLSELDSYTILRDKIIKEKQYIEKLNHFENKVETLTSEIEELKKLIKERLNV